VPYPDHSADEMARALSAASEMRAYVSTRPGAVIVVGDAARDLGMTADDADLTLRVVAVGLLDGSELTSRRGGWIYRPAD
jgi:hypothetical protein